MANLNKIIIFATFIVTLLCSLKIAGAQPVQKAFENYIFVFEAQDSILVNKLVQKVKPGLNRLNVFFGTDRGPVITIYLTPSKAEFLKQTRNVLPEWSQAVAFTSQRMIVLRVASAEEVQTAPQTLLHEITHMHVASLGQRRQIPVWLNEGLAQFFSGKGLSLDDKIAISNALAARKIIQLNALDSLHSFSTQKARLAYIQALSATQFFVNKHGRGQLRKLLDNLLLYHSVNDAFRNTVGYDFVDFEINWYEDLDEKYKWLFVLNLDNLLWVSMGLLALLAIAVVRRRNRKKIEAWETGEPAEMFIREHGIDKLDDN